MQRVYHKWYSENLQRDMEMLEFGHAGRAVLFFPTRMARFYDYENWKVIEAVKDKLEQGELHVFCVDSIDAESFYNQGISPQQRIERHLQYEQYILREVLPKIFDNDYDKYLIAAGCSMGAYHAVNLAFKYPKLFNKTVGMSGRYDLTRAMPDFADLFDGYRNDLVYFNMPEQYMSNMQDEAILLAIKKLEIILAIGETDQFIGSNKALSYTLNNKHVPHQLYIWDGEAHRPRFWRRMVQLYL